MPLYIDPVATTCRAVLLFLADHHMRLETRVVSLAAGEHLGADFTAVNPNQAVPALVEDGWTLTECSAILKHLAESVGSPTYPADPRDRAGVNAAMDWFNTGFYRDFGYHYVYPQVFPHCALPAGQGQEALLAMGLAKARRWLDILERHMLADQAHVAGSQPTLADYLGAAYVSLGDWVGFDLSPWPRAAAWLERMRARRACREVWDEHDRFAETMRRMRADAEAAA
jgi:glutathione S-transferase